MTTRSRRGRTAGLLAAAAAAFGGLAVMPVEAGASEAAVPESHCAKTGDVLTCEHNTTTILTAPGGVTPREVHWQVPLGEAPAGGWPAVVVFSPSLWSAALSWSVSPAIPLGPYHQTETYQALLDSGFAVITPETHVAGYTFWDTNNVAIPYDISPDKVFVEDILANIGTGTFGPLNPGRLFATGMSSGGYMTSRMAVSHPGHFKALAIQSASYATCGGPLCAIPADLPDDHPPTLFLHGGIDPIVPIWTMYAYRDQLRREGVMTKSVVDDFRIHEFLPAAPVEITAWFQQWDPGPSA